jgi:hypothetical protein
MLSIDTSNIGDLSRSIGSIYTLYDEVIEECYLDVVGILLLSFLDNFEWFGVKVISLGSG